MTSIHDQSDSEIIADRDYWVAVLPEGWDLIGWTYRQSATLAPPRGECLDVTSDHIPLLEKLAAAPELRAENERLRGALNFYADPRSWTQDKVKYRQVDDSTSTSEAVWTCPANRDRGTTARAALKEPEE